MGLDPFCHTVDALHKLKDKLEVRDPSLLCVWNIQHACRPRGTYLERKMVACVCHQPV